MNRLTRNRYGMRREVDGLGIFVGVVAIGIVACILAAIGYAIWYEVNDPGHGQVTKRHYIPAYYWYSTQCMASDSKGNCISSMQIPHYAPECFSVEYYDGSHPGDACVSPEEYEFYEPGSYYPKGWRPE